MVAPEPNEPLLPYITVTAKAVSMVLVMDRLEPQQPQVLKGASTSGSGMQDRGPLRSQELRRQSGPSSQRPR
jgi:hypothetical protein